MTQLITDTTIKLPVLREDVELTPGPKELDGSPTWTIHDPISNQYYRIGWDAYEIISLMPFAHDAHQIVSHINHKTSLDIGVEQIYEVISFLIDNQLVVSSSESQSSLLTEHREKLETSFLKKIFHGYIFFKIKILNPNYFLDRTLFLAQIFYTKVFFYFSIFVLCLSLFLTFQRLDEFTNTFQHFFTWEGAIIYALSISIVKIFHEFGHAYAAKRNGLDVTDLGIAFIVLYPILYTDTTDSWKLQDVKKRRNIGLSGIGAEFYIAIFCLFMWHITPEGTLKSMMFVISTLSFSMSLLINLNPLMRLDGYYLFSDFLGIDNLQDRSFELARRRLRNFLWGWKFLSPERSMNREMESFLIKYAYATWAYRFTLFLGIALLVYNIFPKPFGLILMLIELGFFIAIPILRELIIWCKEVNLMRITINGIITLIILSTLVTAFIYPWHKTMNLPAIIHISHYQKLVLPYSAKLTKIDVLEGQKVEAGDTLLTFTSDELTNNVNRIENDIKNIDIRLEAIERNQDLIKERSVLLEQKEKLLQEVANNRKTINALNLRADKSGYVRDIEKNIHTGRWMSKGDRLLTIVENPSSKNVIIHAYANERQLPLIPEHTKGFFYDETGSYQKINVSVIDVGKISHVNLPWKELSSRNGGPIAVDTEEQDDNISHEPLYHIKLIAENDEQIKNIQQQVRGYVSIEVERESFSSQLFRTGVALFNREFSL